MEITEITVSYGLTQSLPEYSNVKPMVTLKAVIGEGEDVADVRAQLFEQARLYVEEEVDQVLERNGKAAIYSQEPRFEVIAPRRNREYGEPKDWVPLPDVVAIVPAGTARPSKEWFGVAYDPNRRGFRHKHAMRIARDEAKERGCEVADCWDGDLSQLPQRPPAPAEEEAHEPDLDGELVEDEEYRD